tara:strand:+ start:4313 stop:4603 length:291 start_codon:yes stop_codon:yes gene_type:complete
MEDYKIEFQGIIDNFSIDELSDFHCKLGLELKRRITSRKEVLKKELSEIEMTEQGLNYFEDFYYQTEAAKEKANVRSGLEQRFMDDAIDSIDFGEN